jgi:hypothetical protein
MILGKKARERGSKREKRLLPALLLVGAVAVVVGCNNDLEKVSFFNPKKLPNQSVADAAISRSSSGNVQMRLVSAKIERYIEPENRNIYPEGLAVDFLNEDGSKKAYLWASVAEEFVDRRIVEARDSVVVIDYGTGDTVYLRNLTWNRDEGMIYSNDSLRAKNGQRITIGDGFESDEAFENPHILHQRGTIDWKETEE